ncbi:histidine kinase [Agreia sp. VKM Ac-1783]|uniref:sensor histidine kinase n=1 Tax=Agreia sp. VKM Ac-1783 TaxID=1938889 RepID=UPI000A2AEA22|nr:histidine kinase [Agreia sp. VKM Ac-1783]SMQ60986.1 Signal transduction histidine kinase [Agreia sp. VKM Ac-1783]
MTLPMSEADRDGSAARRRRVRTRPVDVLIALSWVLLACFSVAVSSTMQVVAPAVLVLLVAAGLVFFRRSRPVLSFAISFLATLPLALFDPTLGTLAVGYSVYAISVYDAPRRAWACASLSAGVILAVAVLSPFDILPGTDPALGTGLAGVVAYVVTGFLILLVALLWGQNSGSRKRYVDGLLERAHHLEREHDQQVQLAALAERSRIARDVHDIVAHSLSVIVRLGDGASAVVEQEPRRAREAIDQVGGVARSALGEMRRVISVLESSPQSASLSVGASREDLERLVEVYRGVGVPVSLTVRGETPAQSGVQMTVFRVVQEALTNVLRHTESPSLASVVVETGRDVVVTVRNDGRIHHEQRSDSVGRGLVGMRERAALYGGTLTAGPDGDGSWLVRLVLPGAGA